MSRSHSVLVVLVLLALPRPGRTQTVAPLDVGAKLSFHARRSVGPMALVGSAASGGIEQWRNSPEEWGQGGEGYGKRVASALGSSAIHGALAFGLDSALHQDPRYFRARGPGFWRRTEHALRGTLLTRTDSGGETLAVWRIGSAYGASFISNQWYPDRLNTVGRGFTGGSLWMGLDFARNLGAEFWPDIKRKLRRRK